MKIDPHTIRFVPHPGKPLRTLVYLGKRNTGYIQESMHGFQYWAKCQNNYRSGEMFPTMAACKYALVQQ